MPGDPEIYSNSYSDDYEYEWTATDMPAGENTKLPNSLIP